MSNPADNVRSTLCTCGSGLHPRRCDVHPGAFNEHVRQLNYEAALNAEIQRLTEELRTANDRGDALQKQLETVTAELKEANEALEIWRSDL